eukprot:349963-Chlamydomonas_euryale.AAC.3
MKAHKAAERVRGQQTPPGDVRRAPTVCVVTMPPALLQATAAHDSVHRPCQASASHACARSPSRLLFCKPGSP